MASFSLLRPSPSPALTIKPSPISLQSPTLHFPTSLTHSFTNLSFSHKTPKPQHLLTPINAQTPNKTTPSEKSTKTPPQKPTKTPPSTTPTSSTPKRVKFNQLLAPKKTKFRKQHRGRMKGKACRGSVIRFGKYALQALEPAWITSRQIRAGGLAMSRHVKKYEGRGGRIWVRIFPDKPVTVKPAGTRMGSGKGSPEFWVFVVKPGRIIFEMSGVPESVAREAFALAASKFPMRTKFFIADEGKPFADSNSLVPIVAVEEENEGGLSSEMQVMI